MLVFMHYLAQTEPIDLFLRYALQTAIFAEQTLHPATLEQNLSPMKPITVLALFRL